MLGEAFLLQPAKNAARIVTLINKRSSTLHEPSQRLESFEALFTIVTEVNRAAERGTEHGMKFGIIASAVGARDMLDDIEFQNALDLHRRAEAECFELLPSGIRNPIARPVHFGFEIDLHAFEAGILQSICYILFDIGSSRARNECGKKPNFNVFFIHRHVGNHSQI